MNTLVSESGKLDLLLRFVLLQVWLKLMTGFFVPAWKNASDSPEGEKLLSIKKAKLMQLSSILLGRFARVIRKGSIGIWTSLSTKCLGVLTHSDLFEYEHSR